MIAEEFCDNLFDGWIIILRDLGLWIAESLPAFPLRLAFFGFVPIVGFERDVLKVPSLIPKRPGCDNRTVAIRILFPLGARFIEPLVLWIFAGAGKCVTAVNPQLTHTSIVHEPVHDVISSVKLSLFCLF